MGKKILRKGSKLGWKKRQFHSGQSWLMMKGWKIDKINIKLTVLQETKCISKQTEINLNKSSKGQKIIHTIKDTNSPKQPHLPNRQNKTTSQKNTISPYRHSISPIDHIRLSIVLKMWIASIDGVRRLKKHTNMFSNEKYHSRREVWSFLAFVHFYISFLSFPISYFMVSYFYYKLSFLFVHSAVS